MLSLALLWCLPHYKTPDPMWLDAEDDIHGLLMDQKMTTYTYEVPTWKKTRQRVDQAIETKGTGLLPKYKQFLASYFCNRFIAFAAITQTVGLSKFQDVSLNVYFFISIPFPSTTANKLKNCNTTTKYNIT